jgi:hypothetical protein
MASMGFGSVSSFTIHACIVAKVRVIVEFALNELVDTVLHQLSPQLSLERPPFQGGLETGLPSGQKNLKSRD